MLGIKLLFFVHCAIFIGVSGYGIGNHLKASENIEGNKTDSDEIIGGNEVDIIQYPHQVSLIWKIKSTISLGCGGSIISEQFVLTAAHCVPSKTIQSEFKIRAGSKYFKQGGTEYNIDSITVHPKYNSVEHDYDAALIRTSERIDINGQTTKFVQLASSDNLDPGTLVTVTGWGRTETGMDSEVLKAVSLPIVDRAKCNKKWNDYGVNITDRVICAGYDEPGKSACHGDSGGPLVSENDMVLRGIVSFGSPDCMVEYRVPNAYTNVAAIRAWIKQVAGV